MYFCRTHIRKKNSAYGKLYRIGTKIPSRYIRIGCRATRVDHHLKKCYCHRQAGTCLPVLRTAWSGKTTCARIFAKTINCQTPTAEGEACNQCESCLAFNEQRSYNIHELDAASNNSVEDIRSLIEQVRIPPQIGKYKVYIIDEVHMLSQAAFNAFLKTLEEPPHHAIFILATTEKHKILPTILSRCQIYDFNRIGIKDTIDHLQYVAKLEHINAEPEALTVIAQKADGGMRDALSIFDQVVSFTGGNITYKSVIENLNVLDYEYYFKLTDLLLENKVPESMLLFNDVLKKGFDGSHFITGLSSHFRDLLVSKDPSTLQLLEVGAGIRDRYKEQAQKCDQKFLYRAMKLCNDCDLNYRASKNKRLLVELTLIQCAQLTLPDADDVSGGRGPKKILKPLFTQQAASTAATQPQPQAKTAAAQTAATAAPQPQGTSTAGSMNASRPSPLPQTREEKKSRCSRRAHSVYPCAVLCTNSKPRKSKKQKRQAPLPKTMPHTKIIFSMKKIWTITGVNLQPPCPRKRRLTPHE